jgi:hypothetical protein
MGDSELPSFEEASARLRAFLDNQSLNSDLLWICREVFLEQWPKLYVKLPMHNECCLAERIYDEGLRRGIGVELQVFCFVEGRPCCYVWIPKDEIDASYRMLSGLKLCIREPGRQIVVPVKSRFRWFWLNWFSFRHLRRSWAEDIPERTLLFDGQNNSTG